VLLIPIVLVLVQRAPVAGAGGWLLRWFAGGFLLAIQELLKVIRSLQESRPFHWPTYIFVGLCSSVPGSDPGHDNAAAVAAVFAGFCRVSQPQCSVWCFWPSANAPG